MLTTSASRVGWIGTKRVSGLSYMVLAILLLLSDVAAVNASGRADNVTLGRFSRHPRSADHICTPQHRILTSL